MNIPKLIQRIHDAECAAHRTPNSVQILAVSKGQNLEAIQKVFDAGLHNFGESYCQEALKKIQSLANLPICWHFIGPLQSNKARLIANHVSWVESLSRPKTAFLLNEARHPKLPPLNVCLQVNIDNEATKQGVAPNELETLALEVLKCSRLNLRGLMVIPKPTKDKELQYDTFLKVRALLNRLNQNLKLNLDTLSMGMSDDFIPAIRAGSTMVRLGRAIFQDMLYSNHGET